MTNIVNRDFKAIGVLDKLIMLFFFLYMVSYNIFSYRLGYVIISHITLFITISVTIVYLLLKSKLYGGKFFWLLYAFLLWSATTYFWSPVQSITFNKVVTLAQLCAVSYIFYNYFDTKKKIKKAILIITSSFIVLGVYTVYVYGFNNLISGSVSSRIGAEISQENILGMSLATGALLCFYYAYFNNKRLFYIPTIFLFLLTSFTGSRKALLIVFIGGILLFVFMNLSKNIIKPVITFLLMSVILYLILQLPIFSNVMDRIDGLIEGLSGNGQMEESAQIRADMIVFGWKLFIESPFIGYGFDSFRHYWGNYTNEYTYSHNNYIEMLINGGVIAFGLYYFIYLYTLSRLSNLWLRSDKTAILLTTLIIIQLIMDTAMVSYDSKITYIYFAIFFAFIREVELNE